MFLSTFAVNFLTVVKSSGVQLIGQEDRRVTSAESEEHADSHFALPSRKC